MHSLPNETGFKEREKGLSSILNCFSYPACIIDRKLTVRAYNTSFIALNKTQWDSNIKTPFFTDLVEGHDLKELENIFIESFEKGQLSLNIETLSVYFYKKNATFHILNKSHFFDWKGERLLLLRLSSNTETSSTTPFLPQELSHSFIESEKSPILFFTPLGTIFYANLSFQNLLHHLNEPLVGQRVDTLFENTNDPTSPSSITQLLKSHNNWKGVLSFKKGTSYPNELQVKLSSHPKLQSYVLQILTPIEKNSNLPRTSIQAEKMQAISTLTSGIAHDFNNILYAILGYAELTLDDVKNNNEAEINIQEIIKAGNRAAQLVKHLLLFSKPSSEEKVQVLLQVLIRETLKYIRKQYPSTIQITHQIDEESPPVFGNPAQLFQVILNICNNSFDSFPSEAGTIKVQLKKFQIQEENNPLFPKAPLGNYNLLTIQDDGKGIPSPLLSRIFEPYYSTQNLGDGRGLGLSIVYGIIEEHKGYVQVQSQIKKGTTFYVLLPIHHSPEEKPSEKSPKPHKTKPIRILFLDDEKMIAQMGQVILENLGYLVHIETSGHAGIKHFSKQPNHYDLIITDQTMPDITGTDLAKEIRTFNASIPIILSTGFGDFSNSTLNIKEISKVIYKPLNIKTLSSAIQEVLANSNFVGETK